VGGREQVIRELAAEFYPTGGKENALVVVIKAQSAIGLVDPLICLLIHFCYY